MEPWFVLWSFSLLKLFCIPINLLYGHAWNTVVMFGLTLQVATCNCYISYKNGPTGPTKRTSKRTVGPSLAASLESLTHRRNIASLSLFYRYNFGRCSSELVLLAPILYFQGRFSRYSDRLHDFSVTITRCYKDVYVNSFFPCTARL